MLKGKSLLEYDNLFSPSECKKNVGIILKYFQEKLKWKQLIVLLAVNIKKLKNPKISYTLLKTLVLSIICSKCGIKDI